MKNPETTLKVPDTEIIKEFPPNIDAIRDALGPLTGNEIFAYDNAIYHPGNGYLTPELIMHENVHFRQQEDYGGSAEWWQKYLRNEPFRWKMEMEAHRAELRAFIALHKNRNDRFKYADKLVRRLQSPMYRAAGMRGRPYFTIMRELKEGIMK